MAQSVQRVAEAARPALDPEKQRLKVKARMYGHPATRYVECT